MILKIVLELADKRIELSWDEGKKLWKDLKQIYGVKTEVQTQWVPYYPHNPFLPYSPRWYGKALASVEEVKNLNYQSLSTTTDLNNLPRA